MAQESKVTEKLQESEAKHEEKSSKFELIVSRSAFNQTEDGENLYSYFIDAVFRGQKQRISLAAEDNGSYSYLNIIFGDTNQANARFVETKFKPDENSEPMIILSVEVFVIDDGIEYSAPLKAQRKSDKTCLNTLYSIYKASKKK